MMKHWTRTLVLFILLITVIAWAKKYFISLFFHPDRYVVTAPKYYRVDHEELFFLSHNDRRLHAYFLKSNGNPKGTVVHCHGNSGNISQHFPELLFLCRAGYNVFMFDYEGYGESEGIPSPAAIVHDAQAALEYVTKRVDKNRIALFGQSLGGAAATEAMAKNNEVKCLILEGAFTTYREMAWATKLGKMLFFITPFLIPDRGPFKSIPDVAPRPVLIIHGDVDSKVPVRFARKLYNAAKEKKSLLIINGFHHLQGCEGTPEYEKTIVDFLKQNLP